MIEIKLSFDTDRDRALEDTRWWSALALSQEQKATLHDPMEMERAGDALPIEQIASRWIVASSADEVLKAVQPYVDAGFTHLVFHPPGDDQSRFLRLFADEVLPALRSLPS
jgi:coenzyme F420-dependent glucose-6-phosphate dehydrogenase